MGGPGSGRKSRPLEQKELTGERNDRVNPNPPVYDKLSAATPPADMHVYGQEVWNIWAPQLIKSGVMATTDLPAFRILCEAFGEYRMALEHLQDEGYVITQYNKDSTREVVNPWQRVRNDAEAKITKYMARFGLTPADRAGLVLPEPPNTGNKDDPARFLA